jgi:CheY-like chemotaxis protein
MNFGKKRIFLVDDDIIFEDIVVNFLSDEYEIMLSHSGEEALNKSNRQKKHFYR